MAIKYMSSHESFSLTNGGFCAACSKGSIFWSGYLTATDRAGLLVVVKRLGWSVTRAESIHDARRALRAAIAKATSTPV